MQRIRSQGGKNKKGMKPSFFAEKVNKFWVKNTKQNVSDFVKRMREIDAIPRSRLVWYSKQKGMKGNTYIKAKHGKLS